MVVTKEISTMIQYLHLHLMIMMMMMSGGTGSGAGLPAAHKHHHYSLETDKAALLAFKSAITSDPYSSLANWNESTPVCNFTGIECGGSRDLHRVEVLNLNDYGLVGTLSPFISNLTHLTRLELLNNLFYGLIPSQISSLGKLEQLNLDGNALSGPIPQDSFSYLPNLILVTMSGNKLNGTIPPSLFSNCTFLEYFTLSSNQLSGRIPPEIGNCPILWNVDLHGNQFTGEIPVSLSNATQLITLDVEYNQLSGELPVAIVSRLPIITFLYLSYNKMTSHDDNTNLQPFFTALSNCTQLWELDLIGMGLGGSFPHSINIGGISTQLGALSLQKNHIHGQIPLSLTNATQLRILNVEDNQLSGELPVDIVSRLPMITYLRLSNNNMTSQDGNTNLQPLFTALSNCTQLSRIELAGMGLGGSFPRSISTQLQWLSLEENQIHGEIPFSLTNATELRYLNVEDNQLSGELPVDIVSRLPMINYLRLSNNNMTSLNGNTNLELFFTALSNCTELWELRLASMGLGGSLAHLIF